MLHETLAPSPQAVENIFLAELHSNHHAIRHPFGAGIVVLDVGNITHGIAHFEIDFVGTAEHIVEDFLQLGVDISLFVAHFNEEIAVLARFESPFLPRGNCHCGSGQHQKGCENDGFLHVVSLFHQHFLAADDVNAFSRCGSELAINGEDLPLSESRGGMV